VTIVHGYAEARDCESVCDGGADDPRRSCDQRDSLISAIGGAIAFSYFAHPCFTQPCFSHVPNLVQRFEDQNVHGPTRVVARDIPI
jgi:hypothetical protein